MGHFRSSRGNQIPLSAGTKRLRLVRFLFVVGCAAALIVAAGWFVRLRRYAPAGGYVTTDDYAEIRSAVPGLVMEIAAASGDTVARGALLVQLDDASQRAEVAEREKALDKSLAELALREAELADKRRQIALQIEAAGLALEHAGARLEVTRQLAERGLSAARELGEDTYKVKAAETELRRLRAFDATVDEREIDVLRRETEARREALRRARAELERLAIRAPMDGVLSRYTFYPGEVIRPETLLYEIFGGTNLVLKLRVPERYATRVRPGHPLRAVLTAEKTFPPRYLYGRVEAMRDVIQSDGAAGYRVVYASLDANGKAIPPGSTAEAEICYGRGSFWAALFGL